jgi:hypothetical protein
MQKCDGAKYSFRNFAVPRIFHCDLNSEAVNGSDADDRHIFEALRVARIIEGNNDSVTSTDSRFDPFKAGLRCQILE